MTWTLDTKLMHFDMSDQAWTVRDACQHTQIFGATGSGKTSGSGYQLAKAFLSAGFGGLVLSAKESEPGLWRELAAEFGREDDLIIVDAAGSVPFNFMNYELKRGGSGGGQPGNLADMLVEAERVSREQAVGTGALGGDNDKYFRDALARLLKHTILVAVLGEGTASIEALQRLIQDSPTSREEAQSETWKQRSSLHAALMAIAQRANELEPPERQSFEDAGRFWLRSWPQLPDRTRESIRSTWENLADLFLESRFRGLFCGGTKVLPEQSKHGKIVVLDLAPSEHGAFGRTAQVLFKYIWQQALLRRVPSDGRDDPSTRPVFIWVDESQDFITALDSSFLNKGREARTCVVQLTQGLPNYHARIGRDATSAMLSSLNTKVFHALGDAETIRYAADLAGQHTVLRHSMSTQRIRSIEELKGLPPESLSEAEESRLKVTDFYDLARGERGKVEAILIQVGRQWPETGPYLRWSMRRRGA